MKIKIIISADEGKVLTDGKTYWREICLTEGESADSIYEISEAEHKRILAEQKKIVNGVGDNNDHVIA